MTTRNQYLKGSTRTTSEGEKLFHNEAKAIEKEKCRINLKKPIYIGSSILHLSKGLMQDFHYKYIKIKCGNKT